MKSNPWIWASISIFVNEEFSINPNKYINYQNQNKTWQAPFPFNSNWAMSKAPYPEYKTKQLEEKKS